MDNYCMKFFYAEKHSDPYGCPSLMRYSGVCKKTDKCPYKMELTLAEWAILDNLRIVKQQNQELLDLMKPQTR